MGKPVPILLLDDERDHALLIQETIEHTKLPFLLQIVESGEQAIAYLAGDGRFADRDSYPFPVLVLLDLRMPGIGGFGVLRWLCAHPDLKGRLSLVVLSAVQCTKEIEVVYELGAQLFWPKSDCKALQDRIRVWHESWLMGNQHFRKRESGCSEPVLRSPERQMKQT